MHLAMSKFTPQRHEDGCSQPPEEMGFGLAGGAYGAYSYCPECGAITTKTPELEDDGQPDEAQEWADFDPEC